MVRAWLRLGMGASKGKPQLLQQVVELAAQMMSIFL